MHILFRHQSINLTSEHIYFLHKLCLIVRLQVLGMTVMVFFTYDAFPIPIILLVLFVLLIIRIRLIKLMTVVDSQVLTFLLLSFFIINFLFRLGRNSLPQVIASIMFFNLLPQL